MLNKEKMIEILTNKIEEGYSIIESLKINDKEFSTAVVNMFEIDKTINQLQQEKDFDEEMINKQEQIEKTLSKNEEVCL